MRNKRKMTLLLLFCVVVISIVVWRMLFRSRPIISNPDSVQIIDIVYVQSPNGDSISIKGYGCFPSRTTGQATPIPNEELNGLLQLFQGTKVRFCKNDTLKEISSDVKLYDIYIIFQNGHSMSFAISNDGYFYWKQKKYQIVSSENEGIVDFVETRI